jgi:hypothetical protein
VLGIERLRLRLGPADSLLGDDPEARLLDDGIDAAGQVAGGSVRLDDGEGALDGHGVQFRLI